MKTAQDFKERFENGEFKEELKVAKSPEDVVAIAKKLGYGITVDDVLKAELADDCLGMIAGGKKDNNTTTTNYNYGPGTGTSSSK